MVPSATEASQQNRLNTEELTPAAATASIEIGSTHYSLRFFYSAFE